MTTLPQPYSQREEWKDVTPIPQDDGPEPICPIVYSAEYEDAMNYFRAISAQKEYSLRALELTSAIIEMNPSHYTIWLYRKDIVFNLGLDIKSELDFVETIAEDNPKCYQLWHHRQIMIEKLGDPSREFAFIEKVLADDAKNFHAWSYRQWVIKHFNLWDQELSFTDRLIQEDIRNNSAWNQRYFAIHHHPTPPDDTVLEHEVTYTLEKIRLAPNNESAWNYLSGTIRHRPELLLEQVEEKVNQLLTEISPTTPLLAFFVENYQEYPNIGNQEQRRKKAIWACDMLAEKEDRIRERYWKYCRDEIA